MVYMLVLRTTVFKNKPYLMQPRNERWVLVYRKRWISVTHQPFLPYYGFASVSQTMCAAPPPLAPLALLPRDVSQVRISFHSCLRAKISNLGVGCVLLEISVDGGCCTLE